MATRISFRNSSTIFRRDCPLATCRSVRRNRHRGLRGCRLNCAWDEPDPPSWQQARSKTEEARAVGFESLIADAIEHPRPSQVNPAPRDGGRGVIWIVEVVDGEHAELGAGLKNVAFPGAGIVEPASGVGDGARPTGREACQPFRVNQLAIFGTPAFQHIWTLQRVEQSV